jgi:endonuclease/exonuclease/phosphatase family metal-dependent hydrolase
MRILALVLVSIALASSASFTQSTPDRASVQTPPRRPRIVVELSDLLTHSRLVGCPVGNARSADAPRQVRIATWNMRAAQDAPVEMLAAEIREMGADVIALQEVDVLTRRGSFVDEPTELAKALAFEYVFAASIKWDEGHYGLAVLSRWPLTKAQRHRVDSSPEAEPRIVLDVTLCIGGRPLRVLNHHADRRTASRALGFGSLRRIAQDDVGRGLLVLADLNEYPDAPGIRSLIDMGFIDLAAANPVNTVSTGRVDYLLADAPLAERASTARVWTTDKSDHHAVLADLEWSSLQARAR